jgi:hypothetical protein
VRVDPFEADEIDIGGLVVRYDVRAERESSGGHRLPRTGEPKHENLRSRHVYSLIWQFTPAG